MNHLSEDNSPVSILPGAQACRQALRQRDMAYAGRLFVGIPRRGCFCHPGCSRLPVEPVVFLPSAGAAFEAGLFPCPDCLPLQMPLPPESLLAPELIRALRGLEANLMGAHTPADLAAALLLDAAEMARLEGLCLRQLGASLTSVGLMLRCGVAQALLANPGMTQTAVAFHAGLGSRRGLNAAVARVFGCSPAELRKRLPRVDMPGRQRAVVRISVRKPYDFDWVFSYLARRALPGVEEVTGHAGAWCFQRRLRDKWLYVTVEEDQLKVDAPLDCGAMCDHLCRIRRIFDTGADGAGIHQALVAHQLLAPYVEARPGLRVPGAWDGFELSVRAILGQQVSVERGTELANKMIHRYGDGGFPTPAQLVHREVAELGMPGRRGQAVTRLAAQALDGELCLDAASDFDLVQDQLQAIAGIGPWTGNYIRMRGLKDPNAFPDNDWVVLKQLKCTAAGARKTAAAWVPWRAYALMYIWYAASRRGKLADTILC